MATYKLPTTWTDQQTAFIDWAVNGSGSCVLEAVAGSGKTTTLLQAAITMPGPVAICCYNNKIGREIKAKLEGLGVAWNVVNAGTIHSFGFAAIKKLFGFVKVDEFKLHNIVDELAGAKYEFRAMVVKLVSLAKQRAIGVVGQPAIGDTEAWVEIVNHFDVIDDNISDAQIACIIAQAQAVLETSNRQTKVIDFDDMVYFPLIHPCNFFQFAAVIIDEAQDTNTSRRLMVAKMVRKGGRLIAVGDKHQAIYGFTGADNNSLDLIARDWNAKRMTLSVTYRCPKAIVEFAHQWVSHIQHHEAAKDGVIDSAPFASLFIDPDNTPEGAILCRVNKHLVKAAFALIRARIACQIEGRDIGKGLIKLATKWSTIKTLNAFETKLEAFVHSQTDKYGKKQPKRIEMLQDQADTLAVIIDQCRIERKDLVSDVVKWVEELFADDVKTRLTLSTIHKSKGREWNRVWWLNRETTCPSRFATQDWMMDQEINLQYVAATRAMHHLTDLVMEDEQKGAVKEAA